ncbi:MAG: chitobiase/beta-hexosaminidase C-terminal domain-containing protein, partial [Bacteroidales bacterium]|nr:chitobiase/beta-hexosaminidase C-terminal domain-containing protein [Bacteroidales bacterium]
MKMRNTLENKNIERQETATPRLMLRLLALALLVIGGWSGAVGQTPTPVNIRSSSLSGRSLQWSEGDSYSAGYVELADDDDTRQQWIMVNAGNGGFYLKNVAAEAAGSNSFLTLYNSNNGNDNWTFSMTSGGNLETSIHYFRARFALVYLGDGKWGIKTMSFKNNNGYYYYTYIGCDAPSGSHTHYTIWGDKLTTNSGEWTIDGLSTISISRGGGQITITATNTTDATVYYTTDGTDPTTSATRQVYSAAFPDEGFGLVKAIVMKDNRPNSEMVSSFDYSKKFIFRNLANTAFCMLPGVANGSDYELNTYSLMRPRMEWSLEDAGDGSFYIMNDSTGFYLSCNSEGTVRLKSTNGNSNDFKFMLRQATDGSYRIEAKAKTYFFLRKYDNNATYSMDANNSKIDVRLYWNIIPSDHIPEPVLPFTLSDDDCAHYIRIHNANASSYYIIPPTGSNANASTSNAGESNDRWFIRQVASDDWLNYYAIINAKTGQCLEYTGVALGSGNSALTTTIVPVEDMATTDNIQFAIAQTSTAPTNGYHYLIPKAKRYANNCDQYCLIYRDNNALKLQLQRADNNHKWVFESSTFTCEEPTFTYDPIQGTMTITSPNNAPVYYVVWGDGQTEPALSTPEDGTLYTASLFVEQNVHFKAIAARCTDGSDMSTVATYNLPEPFHCATPVITFNSMTQQITITTDTQGAAIYYILGDGNFDETAPNFGGILYAGPFDLSVLQMVKAIAVKDNDWAYRSNLAIWDEAPHYVNKASEMTVMTLYYVANEGFEADVTIGTVSDPFRGKFDGAFHPFSLSRPLFGYVDGGKIKNVMISSANVSGSGNIGAIVNEAAGASRIYNCGVLGGTVSGTGYVGSIVGLLDGTSRVINCYSYADVSGGTDGGGIVGYNNYASTNTDIRTMVMNCAYYGNVSGSTHISPVYGGNIISNVGSTGLNNFNYFSFEDFTSTITEGKYNCALGAEKRFLTRFEFYRH